MNSRRVLLLCCVLLAACSSIKSVKAPTASQADGLTYFMPKRDFKATVTIENGAVKDVALGVTAMYPDLKTQYTLQYGTNVFGKNTLDVVVTEMGLLTSGNSTTVSGVSDALQGLAGSIGQIGSLGISPLPPGATATTCPADGSYEFVFTKGSPFPGLCNLTISVVGPLGGGGVVGSARKSAERHSGIFYRVSQPYQLVAQWGSAQTTAIVFSPSESPDAFVPIARTFFSGNDAAIKLSDGVLTGYKQVTDGEAVALLKLPADIIGAYFRAVGQIFDAFSSNDQKEAAALANATQLELAKQKYAACLVAIQKDDKETIKALGCGQ